VGAAAIKCALLVKNLKLLNKQSILWLVCESDETSIERNVLGKLKKILNKFNE
jgi:hypothetical protein